MDKDSFTFIIFHLSLNNYTEEFMRIICMETKGKIYKKPIGKHEIETKFLLLQKLQMIELTVRMVILI